MKDKPNHDDNGSPESAFKLQSEGHPTSQVVAHKHRLDEEQGGGGSLSQPGQFIVMTFSSVLKKESEA